MTTEVTSVGPVSSAGSTTTGSDYVSCVSLVKLLCPMWVLEMWNKLPSFPGQVLQEVTDPG